MSDKRHVCGSATPVCKMDAQDLCPASSEASAVKASSSAYEKAKNCSESNTSATAPEALLAFVKKEPVFCISLTLALISCWIVMPSPAYAEYLKFDVLFELFCFMAVVAGFTELGLFDVLNQRFFCNVTSIKATALTLVALPFVCSMLVTNDVALIAFVPFTMLFLQRIGAGSLAAFIVVMQTIAANMGSMLTPFGNPQNLYVYDVYQLELGSFLHVAFPFVLLTAVLLVICLTAALKFMQKPSQETLHVAGIQKPAAEVPQHAAEMQKHATDAPKYATGTQKHKNLQCKTSELVLFAALFVLSTLAVLQIIAASTVFVIVAVALLFYRKSVFASVDYVLLGTFVCFFVFSGNISHAAFVSEFIFPLLQEHTFVFSLLSSQLISNVPSALLLAPFTADWQALMLGVDLGGLGTPVASLASLISFGYYAKLRTPENPSFSRFVCCFLLCNGIFLAANCLLWNVLYTM